MNEMHTLDRLERRIEYQAARVDDLYGMLEMRGILPCAVDVGRSDAPFDEFFQDEDEPIVVRHEPPTRQKPPRLHLGNATGV